MGFGILSKNSPKTKAPHGLEGIATTNKRGLVHPGVIFGPRRETKKARVFDDLGGQ